MCSGCASDAEIPYLRVKGDLVSRLIRGIAIIWLMGLLSHLLGPPDRPSTFVRFSHVCKRVSMSKLASAAGALP